VAVALFIVHLITVRVNRLAPPDVVANLERMLRATDTESAQRYCLDRQNSCFLTRVFAAALARCARSPFGFLELRSALEEAGQAEVERLHRGTEGVGLIASVAPMLGLLGTVVGMVLAFETIAGSQGFARPDQLAGYISLALVTTVQGLIVAIPATGAFTFMRHRVDRLTGEVGQIIEELASLLQATPEGAAAPKPAERRAAKPVGGAAAGTGAGAA
jgi:biopolymer transport protein ExbB